MIFKIVRFASWFMILKVDSFEQFSVWKVDILLLRSHPFQVSVAHQKSWGKTSLGTSMGRLRCTMMLVI